MSQFQKDLAQAKYAEQLVREIFEALTTDYAFEDVSNDREYFYQGDIKATAWEDGREILIEVKDDSRIHQTHNVLCEDEVYYKDCDYYQKGNMHNKCDIYVVVSQADQKIYVIDFKILQNNYKRGEYRVIEHPTQASYCYLCGLAAIKSWGALIDVIEY